MSDTLSPAAAPAPPAAGPARAGTPVRLTIWRYVIRCSGARVRPAAAFHAGLVAQAGHPDLRRPHSINAFLPVGDVSLDNYTAVFDRVPFWRFMMNSILITLLTVVLDCSSTACAPSPWRGCASAARGCCSGSSWRRSSCRSKRWRCPCCGGSTSCRTSTDPSAGWTPTRCSSCRHRERLLHLPVLLVTSIHPEGTRRGGQGRRRRLVHDLPQDHHAAVRSGDRHRGDPDLPTAWNHTCGR